MQIRTLPSDDAGLTEAAGLLRDGRLVAFPTETVYGLGADAGDDRAVAAIYAAKDRPRFNPLIVHVPSAASAAEFADLPALAERLAAAFWPGPLTLVLRRRAGARLGALVSAGLDTVALRVPAAPLARALLERAGVPVAAPSANPSGRISATTAAHVRDGLGDRIAAVLEGGACPVGIESTILDATGPAIRLLRPGGLPAEMIEDCLGAPLVTARPGPRPNAPGQLASHYAPRGAVRLEAAAARPGEVLLGFGAVDCALNLSPAGDLAEAAANLFPHLHRLDATGAGIAVSPIPERGLGRAINDRLRRAAAPRPT